MLSEHPDIEKRLRQEIFEIVGQTGRPNEEHQFVSFKGEALAAAKNQ